MDIGISVSVKPDGKSQGRSSRSNGKGSLALHRCRAIEGWQFSQGAESDSSERLLLLHSISIAIRPSGDIKP
ncbi:MAG TPA: hypothetical protein IGS17_04655 [Oscillatoriales cyanobacterium M59_W2019_021]|nr:MAG: hypothetical protein D6728_06560 [Cyanobacteria bacterium J055]HIK33792.1 hypothetical protein [Oscillatoriales cyanobacterium M4454_W2019_049]HIK50208.1 hypothetical protein [Oscillatoriales cyanobacterium M59_W2019_021]